MKCCKRTASWHRNHAKDKNGRFEGCIGCVCPNIARMSEASLHGPPPPEPVGIKTTRLSNGDILISTTVIDVKTVRERNISPKRVAKRVTQYELRDDSMLLIAGPANDVSRLRGRSYGAMSQLGLPASYLGMTNPDGSKRTKMVSHRQKELARNHNAYSSVALPAPNSKAFYAMLKPWEEGMLRDMIAKGAAPYEALANVRKALR